MTHVVFFVLAVLTSFWLFFVSATRERGDDKRVVVAFPFLLFIAAAVAKYIGW